jgi:hypothetical protein
MLRLIHAQHEKDTIIIIEDCFAIDAWPHGGHKQNIVEHLLQAGCQTVVNKQGMAEYNNFKRGCERSLGTGTHTRPLCTYLREAAACQASGWLHIVHLLM